MFCLNTGEANPESAHSDGGHGLAGNDRRCAWPELGEHPRGCELSPQAAAPSDEKVALLASEAAPVIGSSGKCNRGNPPSSGRSPRRARPRSGWAISPVRGRRRSSTFPRKRPSSAFSTHAGLAKKAYDPAEDIAFHEARSHLMIAVIKALDPQQDAVLGAVRAARKRHPEWPVIVAQTSLHEAYAPGEGHRRPYPFGDPGAEAGLPPALTRSLGYQRSLFGSLPGNEAVHFVPIDLRSRATASSRPPTGCPQCGRA